MEQLLSSVRGMLESHQLSQSPNQIFVTAQNLCGLVLSGDSNEILKESAARLQILLESDCKTASRDRVLEVTTAAALVLHSAGDKTGDVFASLEATLVDVLLSAIVKNPIIPEEVEASTLCLARIYPKAGVAAVDAALSSIVSVGGDKLPVEASVDLLGYIADQLAANSSDESLWPCQDKIIEAALESVQLKHREVTTVPLIVRKVLLPLFQGRHNSENRATAFNLIQEFSRDENRLPEAIVLTAALFDVLFTASPGIEDLRSSEALWSMIMRSLQVVTKFNEDPSKKATLQLHVIYLLKRIVELTAQEQRALYLPPVRGDKKKVRMLESPKKFRDGYFYWYGSTTESQWENFFLIFDSLNEFGVHLISPMVPKLLALYKDSNSFPTVWVEILFHKFISHGNTGARRLGLGVLWSLDVSKEREFSDSFLYGTALTAAADPKLCTEVDRVVLPGNFLDCKALVGDEMSELPTVLPVICRIEDFYLSILGKDYVSDDAARRALACISGSLEKNSTKFTIAVVLRLLLALAQRLPDRFTNLMDASLVSSFTSITSTLVHDHHPHWLEARFLALLLDTTMVLVKRKGAMIEGVPQLLSLFGKGGSCGGKAFSAFDSSGMVGPVGAALSSSAFFKRLKYWHDNIPHFQTFVSEGQWGQLQEALNEPDNLFTVAKIKALTLLLPLDENSDKCKAIQDIVKVQLGGMSSRTSMSHETKLKYWLLFAEWGSSNVLHWDPSVLSCIWENLRQELRGSFQSLHQAIAAQSAEEISISELSTEAWEFQSTEAWDIVCAASTRCLQQFSLVFGLEKEAQIFGCTQLKLKDEIVHTVEEIVLPLAKLQVSGNREYGRIILYRNACKWLQAIATAYATEHIDLNAAFPGKDSVTAEKLVYSLISLPPQRLRGSDVPCPLSTESWGVLLGQAYRAICNLVFVLCLTSVGPQLTGSALPRDVFIWAEDQLDKCSAANMAAVSDVLLWALPKLDDQAKIDSGVATLHYQAKNGSTKKDGLRVKTALMMTAVKYPSLHEATLNIVDEMLAENMEEAERAIYVATVFTAQVELALTPNGRCVRDSDARAFEILKRLAVFGITSYEEEENEACLAATEPMLSCWDEVLRKDHVPTLRMIAVARTLAISVLLQQVQKNPRSFGVNFVKELIEMNFEDTEIIHEPCMPNSKTHRGRIHLWQIILAATGALNESEMWADLIPPLFRCLSINNMGSVRRYMELTAIQALKIAPNNYSLLVKELADTEQRTQSTGSFALVAAHLLLHPLAKGLDQEVYAAIFPQVLKLCSSQQHLLRIVSQIAVHELIAREKAGRGRGLLPLTRELEALFHYLDKHGEAIKVREKHHSIVIFNAEVASSPAEIFSVQRRESDFWLLESVPRSTFDRIRFVHAELMSALAVTSPFEALRCRQLVQISDVHSCFALFQQLSLIPHAKHAAATFDTYLDYSVELAGSGQQAAAAANELKKAEVTKDDESVQRKVQSWWTSEVHNELHPRALGIKRRQSVIIVASLLDNPVNVAGLCRCSEIWTVEKVVVADKRVFQHPHFVAVARSAELWTPYEVVPPSSLVSYLQQKRSEGYTICGVEQTSTSESLPEYRYPEKSVIVLGSEGQGMPANFIPFMDTCLEIPQYGLIRSLNVHVTGAVALYEYTRQHSMLKKK